MCAKGKYLAQDKYTPSLIWKQVNEWVFPRSPSFRAIPTSPGSGFPLCHLDKSTAIITHYHNQIDWKNIWYETAQQSYDKPDPGQTLGRVYKLHEITDEVFGALEVNMRIAMELVWGPFRKSQKTRKILSNPGVLNRDYLL